MTAGPAARTRRATLAAWVLGIIAFAAVIAVVVRRSELEEMARLLREMRPRWFVAALVLQAGTYVCAAAVWGTALSRRGHAQSTRSLVPVALAMLFTNQAVPTAGLSGSAVVLQALVQRGVPEPIAMEALLVGLVTTYAAYLVAIAATVMLLAAAHRIFGALMIVGVLFGIAAVAVPGGIIWYVKAASPRTRDRVSQVPFVGKALAALSKAPTDMLRDVVVIRRATTLQFLELLLDAGTLYVVLVALGISGNPSAAFVAFVIAYAASSVGLTPLGLGTFEAACIAMLRLFGVGLEAALTATLLLRAFTLWLPMIPGFIAVRYVVMPRQAEGG